ncbi:MAG TPA: hypothetical protein VIK11_04310 [Tepidiformaceae bacterium]
MTICPFLGLAKDPSTPSAVPSELNRCYQDPGSRYVISSTHQSGFCFRASHTSCPAYDIGWASVTTGVRRAHNARPHESSLPWVPKWASPYWSQLLILFVLVAAMLATLMMAAPAGLFGPQNDDKSSTATATVAAELH